MTLLEWLLILTFAPILWISITSAIGGAAYWFIQRRHLFDDIKKNS